MLSLSWAHSVTHGTTGALRRRGSGSAVKQSVEDSSDKLQSIPDQLALAASRSDGRSYTRRGLTTRNKDANAGKDFGYSQLELNLIRPEKESHSHAHTKLSTHYGVNSLSTTTAATAPAAAAIRLGASVTMNDEQSLLDDSETAAEYVANAMKLAYGTQHKEQHLSPHTVATSPSSLSSSTQRPFSTSTEHHHKPYPVHIVPAEHERDHSRGSLLELQIQEELQKQLAQQQALLLAEQQQHQEHQKHQQQQQQPQQQPLQEQQHQTGELPAPAPVYEKEPVTRSYNLYESTSQQVQSGEQNGSGDIERNYLTKYYNYPYPPPHLYRNIEAEAEEKVRLSASTEIPKSEIMKQIEKSVIKYMKELEAEGKILSTPQEQSAASSSSASSSSPPPLTKTYYKPIPSSLSSAAASSEEKRYSSSTIRPKILNPGRQQQQQQHQHQQYHHVQHSQQHTVHAPHASHVIHQPSGYHQQLSKKPQQPHPPHPQQYQSETETAYQAPEIPVDELSPNVEFIYKIKTRAPLQTATVKTVSKPYTLPLKSSEHFDHGAALKNIEEFDLSHVVTTPERIEDDQRVTSKPQKLYFNSEIYHDINSLPYKGDKLRQEHQHQQHHLQHQEYRHKLKAASDSHLDYKGYTGYFAEPEPEFDRERERERDLLKSSSESLHDDGYPLINPYQYVLKKEPKYNEDLHNEREAVWDQPLRLTKHSAAGGIYKSPTGGNLEYDSYSPKFNNNPEGYGYQHTYKTQALRAVGGGGVSGGGGGVSGSGGASIGSSSAGKRGKRGGVPPPVGAQGKKRVRTVTTSPGIVSGKLVKDMEANLALRPPPKN
ncbi:putative uncharacterized protein DDB_G0282129 [Drosophila tropicalis]|uniref:putative uncharacterized protein DDB_G0282129 n=1 Tax=Drosophila tropicalis TaxID=46794 RepID=UPI0035AB8EA3